MLINNKFIHECLEHPHKNRWGILTQSLIFFILFANLIAYALDSVKELHEAYWMWFQTIENITLMLFSFELILRFSTIGIDPEYRGIKGKFKYFFTVSIFIDIISILPFLLVLVGINTSFLRLLRLFRVFKLLRLTKMSSFEKAFHSVFITEGENILVTFLFISILIVILSFVVFVVENQIQPDIFSSIPKTMWWAAVTLSTVGYGDMYPITVIGRIITVMISMIGIAFYAIPGSLFTVALIEEIKVSKEVHRKEGSE
jgi:voltage-gated potassium channel